MKILITTDLYAINTNGVVTSIKNLHEELSARGHDVRILTLSESKRSHKDGSIYYIRSMPIGIYGNMRMPTSYRHRLIKELIDWCPDVIHSQCEFFSFQFARYISKKTNAPLIHTYHTMYEHYITYVFPSIRIGKKLLKLLSRKRLKNVECLVAPTQKVENALHSYGLKNEISVVPSGINLDQHHNRITAQERKEKREALGINEQHVVLINLGRLGTEKNLSELMDLFAKASVENDNLRFLIVGDGPAKTDLEKQALTLGVADRVIFTGMVKPDEVQTYYQLGDVFVSASTSETQGLTYIEAAANGLPLLCKHDQCLDIVMQNGINGYDFSNEEEFFRGIHAMMEDPEWINAAGKRSEEIAATFDKHAFGEAIEKIYKSLIE